MDVSVPAGNRGSLYLCFDNPVDKEEGSMSTTVIATLILIGLFLVLVFLRVPIVYAIGIASIWGLTPCRWR